MNNKKVKNFVSCVCALTLLFGAIPMNSIKAEAEDGAMTTTEGVEFFDTTGAKKEDAQFLVHGLEYDDAEERFVRLDSETAAEIAKTDSLYDEKGNWVNTVYSLARETAGGRIRFNTNSTTIKIEAELYQWDASHVSHAASMDGGKYGFDVYVDTADGSTYVDTAIAETKDEDGNEKIDPGSVFVNKTITLGEAASRDITIYFPITIEVKNVKLTVDEGSTVQNHQKGYDGDGRLVFYGSSITQGGCATKPGNTYVNTVGRNLNMEYIDFGMWGRCKGEPEFAEYIAGLGNISAFIYDFDHNMSKASLLEAVHYPYYEIIREAYPDIPIIMMTRPGNGLDKSRAEEPEKGYSTVAEMKEVIRNSFERAKANGDENVHFVDGESFFGYSKGYMKDNAHPNDAGQGKMAEVVTAVLKRAFAGKKNIFVDYTNCTTLLSEDFTYESGDSFETHWDTNVSKNAVSSDFRVLSDESGNDVYQLKYERGSNAPISSIKNKENVLGAITDFAVEMDVVLAYEQDYSYLGLAFEEANATDRYEMRLTPSSGGYKLSLVDRSNGSNTVIEEVSVSDAKFKGNWKKADIPYKMYVELRDVVIGNVESKQMVVSVDGEVVANFTFVPKDATFSPETVSVYLYTRTSTSGIYAATIDNIKVYGLSHKLRSVAEVPSTPEKNGTKAHYVCDLCGKKFLDADGIITTTELALAKSCYLIHEEFESGVDGWSLNDNCAYEAYSLDTIQKDDGTTLGQMQYTRTNKASDLYMQYNKGVLEGKTNYVLEMDEVSMYHSADTKKWTSLGIMLRQRGTGSTIEFRIQGYKTGLNIVPWLNGVKQDTTALKFITIEDAEIGDIYQNFTAEKMSYDLRMEVTGVGSNTITCIFNINGKTAEFTIADFDCEPTGLQIRLYGGSTKDNAQVYKATFDNIKIHTDSHTLNKVAKVESTEETAGTKVHYECDTCGKKFLDSAATKEASEDDVKYAALNEIKCQKRTNDNGLTDIRFVAYVDDYTQYKSVKFKITLTESGKSGTYTCKNAYWAVDELGIMRTTDYLYSVDGYFAAFKLFNNTDAQLAEELEVEVTWTDLQGNTKKATRTFTNLAQQQ